MSGTYTSAKMVSYHPKKYQTKRFYDPGFGMKVWWTDQRPHFYQTAIAEDAVRACESLQAATPSVGKSWLTATVTVPFRANSFHWFRNIIITNERCVN